MTEVSEATPRDVKVERFKQCLARERIEKPEKLRSEEVKSDYEYIPEGGLECKISVRWG